MKTQPLTYTVEIDLPEHASPASGLRQWAAELLTDVGDRLRELGYDGDPSKPEKGLGYGYLRDTPMLRHAKVEHEVTTGRPFHTNVPACLAGPRHR